MLLCEAAGFDVVLVETVGVGQSEVAVAGMVDLFVLVLVHPARGDELQGIKRGIMELADLVVVNKADGDLAAARRRPPPTTRTRSTSCGPAPPAWSPRVLTCSALLGEGIAEVWDTIVEYRERGRRRARPIAGRTGPAVDVVGGHRHAARGASGAARRGRVGRRARSRNLTLKLLDSGIEFFFQIASGRRFLSLFQL